MRELPVVASSPVAFSSAEGRYFLLRHRYGTKFKVTKELSSGKIMALAFKEIKLAGGTADDVESDLWVQVFKKYLALSFQPPDPLPLSNPLLQTYILKLGPVFLRLSVSLR